MEGETSLLRDRAQPAKIHHLLGEFGIIIASAKAFLPPAKRKNRNRNRRMATGCPANPGLTVEKRNRRY